MCSYGSCCSLLTRALVFICCVFFERMSVIQNRSHSRNCTLCKSLSRVGDLTCNIHMYIHVHTLQYCHCGSGTCVV